jgi:hypothetical protein
MKLLIYSANAHAPNLPRLATIAERIREAAQEEKLKLEIGIMAFVGEKAPKTEAIKIKNSKLTIRTNNPSQSLQQFFDEIRHEHAEAVLYYDRQHVMLPTATVELLQRIEKKGPQQIHKNSITTIRGSSKGGLSAAKHKFSSIFTTLMPGVPTSKEIKETVSGIGSVFIKKEKSNASEEIRKTITPCSEAHNLITIGEAIATNGMFDIPDTPMTSPEFTEACRACHQTGKITLIELTERGIFSTRRSVSTKSSTCPACGGLGIIQKQRP